MPGVSYRDLRGDWIQELIDKGLVDPLPNRISIYQVLVTGGYLSTHTPANGYSNTRPKN